MVTRVLNRDRLNRKLAAIPELFKPEIRKAMEKSAAEIVSMAKGLVPIDFGDLQESIGWTWGEAPEGSVIIAQSQGASDMVITVYAGSKVAYYARWVEFGTAASQAGERIVRSGRARVSGGSFGMQAQPFFFPAYRTVRKRVRGRVKRAVTKAAKQAAGLK
jgi:HK97 gp10 family phage protein